MLEEKELEALQGTARSMTESPTALVAAAQKTPESSADSEGETVTAFWGVRFDNTDARQKRVLQYVLVMGGFLILVNLFTGVFSQSPLAFIILLGPIIVLSLLIAYFVPSNPNQNFELNHGNNAERLAREFPPGSHRTYDDIVGRITLGGEGIDGMLNIPWTDVADVFIRGSLVVLVRKRERSSFIYGYKIYLRLKNEAEAQQFFDIVYKKTHP